MKTSTLFGIAALVFVLAPAAWWCWTPDRPRAELEAAYLHTPADLVDVAGVRLHLRDSGPRGAPALLLLHGFGASLQTWDAWVPALQNKYRVLRIDLPGSGLSAPDPGGDYSDARTLQLLTALLNQLGIERVSLVGHSIGGRIAWRFAAEHPQRVQRLVLVAPDGFASPGSEYGSTPEVPAMLALMRWVLPPQLLRMSLEPAYADPKALTDALAERYHALMLAPGVREAMLARLRQRVLVDPLPLLARITAPTLLLWGEQDAMIPVSNADDYLRAIRGSRAVHLPRVGHVPQEEAPQHALAALSVFLVDADSATGAPTP